MYKAVLFLLLSCSVPAFSEMSVRSFALSPSALTTNSVSSSVSEFTLYSWGVSYPSNVWGSVSLYKQDLSGNNIFLDSISTTNRGTYGFLVQPVRFKTGEKVIVDATAVNGSGGAFNGTVEE